MAFLNTLRDGNNAIPGSRLFQTDIELTETETCLRTRRIGGGDRKKGNV